MNEIDRQIIQKEVLEVRRRIIEKLDFLNLDYLLSRMNPYLYAATSHDSKIMISRMLDANIAASIESVFGSVLENIAIEKCGSQAKASASGLDLDIVRKIRLLVALKSGKSWANNDSGLKLQDHFNKAKRTIAQNVSTPVKSVVACCYGKSRTSHKNKIADITTYGQNTWAIITGELEFYKEMLHEMRFGVDEFERCLQEAKQNTCNRLVKELHSLCGSESELDMWDCLVDKCCKNYSPSDDFVNFVLQPE